MEESTSSENVWCKSKAEEQNSLYHEESITQSMEASSTSLADIFNTAFTSTVDPSPQSRFNSANEMEYEHLFAESDIEDSDVVPINRYVNSPHHPTPDNAFVCGSYLRAPEAGGGILHERDPPVKHRSKKREEHKLINQSIDQPIDSLSVAGPSRLSDGISNSTIRSTASNGTILSRVIQNIENDSANEPNTLYHSVLPNTINPQQQSIHTRNDDTPSAPDLQLDWSSSSDDATSSDDEDGSVEVLGTVNHNNKQNSVQTNEEGNRPVTVVDLTVESDEEHTPPTPTTSVVNPTDYVHSGNNSYCMHGTPDYMYHNRCMHHNYRTPVPVIPVGYGVPDILQIRPRMHPVQERLWRIQQRVQEVHRRCQYPRFSSHHTSTSSCNPHVHQANQHTCNNGNSNPPNNRCNGTENMTYVENYLPSPILPPPQQPTVYSHPEARGAPSFSPPCPVQPYVGEFGLYQKILFILMIPFASFVAWVYFSQIFITLTPEEYWCWVPELEDLTVDERLSLAIPKGGKGYSKCIMYDVNYTEILLNGSRFPDASWPTKACQHGWEFNYTVVPYASVAAELGWVCEYDALPTIAQSIFFVGAIFGGLIFGWIADRYGRIPALIGANLTGCFAGIATAFTNNFWQFTLCRFFVGFAFDNCFTMMYILVLEYVGPKWRTFVANMSIAIFFTFAACVLPWIAYYLADWRMTCIATSVPLILAVAAPFLIPESARWLVSQGQVDRAIKILHKFEQMNGTKVPDDIYKRFRETCERICKEEEADKTYSVLDLFRTPRLRKITILFIVIWMAVSLVFDGHVRNVDNLGLNMFVTFTIAAATELPADTFLTAVLDRWGRRWLACGSLVISGIFSIWACAVSNNIYTATLAILGRFWINISYNIGLQYAAEVLPTVVRAQGVALIHIMGYVASILSPFVVYLDVVSSVLPLLVLGILGILAGFVTLFLPETLDKDLPQTLQDGENFGMDQKMWDAPCFGKKHEDEETPPVAMFRSISRDSIRNSMRASLRGEAMRSSMIRKSSVRSRKGGDLVTEVEKF